MTTKTIHSLKNVLTGIIKGEVQGQKLSYVTRNYSLEILEDYFHLGESE